MGFPQNTYEQQRMLSKNAKKSVLSSQLQNLKNNITQTIESIGQDESTMQESFVEMVANYVIRFFTESILEKKSISIKALNEGHLEFVAIKNDFDYYLIG